MSFGGFQPSQEGKKRELPVQHRQHERFACLVCSETMLSDEALQLHRIWHAIMTQNHILADDFDKLSGELD